jgi:hypothetical protein
MPQISDQDLEVSLPLPVFPIVEDVGWWRGESAAASAQPYRNAFPRRHCLADYQALALFARELQVRIALGMVLCEWDRTNYLRRVPGATWMGRDWDNRDNQGPWLDEAAEYLTDQRELLELGLHGLGHEFWRHGRMERSEFHDRHGQMRPRQVIESHLQAFGVLLEQNGFSEFPRLFIPPALYHSFGNGAASMQALLHQYGIEYVITRFAKAKQYAPPRQANLSWEAGVGLLERGESPVSWDRPACPPQWDFSGPVLPLHWGNLLHPDPARNSEIVAGWVKLLRDGTAGMERILTQDLATCWSQAAACSFGRLARDAAAIIVDLRSIPQEMPGAEAGVFLKLKGRRAQSFDCRGGRVVALQHTNGISSLQLLPDEKSGVMRLQFF